MLKEGSIIQRREGAPVSYTIIEIKDDGKIMAQINSNANIHPQLPFEWKGEYYKLADVYGSPREIKIGD